MKNLLQKIIRIATPPRAGAFKLNPQPSVARQAEEGQLSIACQTKEGQPNRSNKLLAGLVIGGFLGVTTAWGQTYATPYTFDTIAGAFGIQGGQDGTNGAATFLYPSGVAVDANDNVYVVDQGENTVRRVAPVGTNWVVTTIAGSTNYIGSLDGTNQTIEFDNPCGLARDAANNLYVADSGNHTVRKLSPVGANWVSSTIAGQAGVAGDNDGSNSVATFRSPSGIAVDAAGRLYVADTGNNIIRRVALVGANWVTTTIAGTADLFGGEMDGTNSVAQFTEPSSIAVDAAGNLFVTDEFNDGTGHGDTIRELTRTGTNWVVTTIAGADGNVGSADGAGPDAQFNFYIDADFFVPAGIAVDGADNLYVADYGNALIREVSPLGTNWVSSSLAGSVITPPESYGAGTNAAFGLPAGIAVDAAGRLFVGDVGNSDLWKGTLAPVPHLTFSQAGAHGLLVSWPTSGGYALQTNTSLTSANWGDYAGAVNTTNAVSSTPVLPSLPTLFLRLVN